jgi:hypothetical protein
LSNGGNELLFVQFVTVILTALALVPGGAHLAALPNKISLGRTDYFIVQHIYNGWALFGIVLIGALIANLTHAFMLSRLGERRGYAIAATVLVAVNLAIFFIWTFPVNQVTHNWTSVPVNWSALRSQWEYSHAVNAVVMFAAFVCVTLAVLRRR